MVSLRHLGRSILPVLALLCMAGMMASQSTYGVILGTVTDPSGAGVANARVTITNTDENTSRDLITNTSGDFDGENLLPAHYQVSVKSEGFTTYTATGLLLVARQTLRVDAALQVGQTQQSVTVNESGAGVIATDSQVIQASFDPKALLNLPANIRANGNTSPYQLIQVLPGVQADASGNFSIQGGIQSQTQYSLDGISITNVGGNSPLTNAFPSTESIAEIKVQGVGNEAEYGQVGDITTISKSGTNRLRGDLFWYTQNRALNSLAFGQQEKPQLVANDFGASVGGPVVIPHFYNGHDKTFFYGTYEGFRYPRAEVIQNEVPTAAERAGDFTADGVTLKDLNGNVIAGNKLNPAQISPVAAQILTLYPLPNAGDLTVPHTANYITNKNNDYLSRSVRCPDRSLSDPQAVDLRALDLEEYRCLQSAAVTYTQRDNTR